MLKLRSFSAWAPFFAIGFLSIYLLHPIHGSSVVRRSTPSALAYIARGNEAQENFQAYRKSLAGYYKSLSSALNAHAPDLLKLLSAPDPLKTGYQILPQLGSDSAPEAQPRDRSIGYSWPWTERLIAVERRELTRSKNELQYSALLNETQQRRELERLVLDYGRLYEKLRNIDAHIQYNRFWQAAIAADRAGYDRETELHHEVLERQKVRDELRSLNGPSSIVSLQPIHALVGLTGLTGDLKRREALLTQRIDSAIGQVQTPLFVVREHRARQWIFRVPIYTDIADRDFVATAKRLIEAIWKLRDGAREFRVELDITYIPSKSLYAAEEAPAVGARLDLPRHLQRFPAGAAIFTTGALTTHVQSYAIVLGPHAITPRILAHEFGHLLGFRDAYVRGYEDLGIDGFQVLEVSTDSGDIMADPLTGSVQVKYFEMLLNNHSDKTSRVPADDHRAPDVKLF